MSLTKVIKRVSQLEEQQEAKAREVDQQIDSLQKQLESITGQLEETYMNGDTETGERLSIEKVSLEARIDYLKKFARKRENVPCISAEEERELVNELRDELYKLFVDDKKKLESILKDIDAIAERGIEAMNTVEYANGTIQRLQKKNAISRVDGRIFGFYKTVEGFVNRYKGQTSSAIETLIKEMDDK